MSSGSSALLEREMRNFLRDGSLDDEKPSYLVNWKVVPLPQDMMVGWELET